MKKFLFISALVLSLAACKKDSACLPILSKEEIIINDSIKQFKIELGNGSGYEVTQKEFDSLNVGDTYCR